MCWVAGSSAYTGGLALRSVGGETRARHLLKTNRVVASGWTYTTDQLWLDDVAAGGGCAARLLGSSRGVWQLRCWNRRTRRGAPMYRDIRTPPVEMSAEYLKGRLNMLGDRVQSR